ncbi:XRE family transcriptional regulator [Duganella sp. BJB488]|uniref:helix-turn-helix domain-containing protein n=1 Tax=unclassified Duganella TaxID=2636909 RepID=UPI000E34EC12|nr:MULTISPECIES: helix-turn-helix transcriptional regulator [unclassified Duganella]RFP24663.1 XRE family transcriptional regulator [Duganella sp. BJB489]RFP27023.1 XRE family transcriptional regulator [Duganella sp. BJB488]RFP34711.1 XRE family transcriptional regulator [Duganella sp. BJB480]
MDYPIRTLQQIRPLLVGFRKHAGMSLAQVAALLGVTQQSYAKIEANPAATSVERLFTILRLLGGEIVLAQNGEPGETAILDALPDRAPAGSRPVPATKSKKVSVAAPSKVLPPTKKMEPW